MSADVFSKRANLRCSTRRSKLRGIIVVARILIVFAILILVFGVFVSKTHLLVALPRPSGFSPVGTTVLTLPTVGGDADARALPVQMWYPTTMASGETAPYAYGLKRSLRNRLVYAFVRTNAIREAPIAPGRWPVVLSLPGVGGDRSANTALSEEIASYGYVVVAMNDERITNGGTDTSSPAAIARTMVWGARRVRLQASDVTRAIDALYRVDRARAQRFAGKLDLNRIGIFGYSFGGSVAAEAAVAERRISAAVDLDGPLFGQALVAGVDRPFMILTSVPILRRTGVTERMSHSLLRNPALLLELSRHGGYVATVANFGHFNFTDAALTPSLRQSGRGSLPPLRGYGIERGFVRTFFDRHLKGSPAPLLDERERLDSAVTYRRFEGPAIRLILSRPATH